MDCIIKNQFGYQKGKSTTDCIFLLQAIIAKVIHSGHKLYSAFIDYEKCYDKINLPFLWQKLTSQNISTKIINAIKAMYSTVRSVVKNNNELSDILYSHQGVKQGDCGSSLLFMMFVNDILNNINSNIDNVFSINEIKLFLILYADDQVLFATSPAALQSMLKDIEIYCNTWKLKINTLKTKIMIFERSTRYTNIDFFLNNEKLEIVNSFKYLGVNFFKNGNWNRTQKNISEHASKAMHKLFSVFNQYEFKLKEKLKLFDVLISPILNYSAEVWGNHMAKDIELIHSKFLRKLLCVKTSTNLVGLYGELGRIPMHEHRKIIMFRYWIKILNLNENSIIKQVYLLLKNDADNGINYNKNNWASQIKEMLEQLGLTNLWINQERITISLESIKIRILDQFKQNWLSNINQSGRLSTYCMFKTKFEFEPYLHIIKQNKYRIALSKFRLSSHNLEIEQGRYYNIERAERKCKICCTNLIENEYHFMLTCPLYSHLRRKYFKSYYCRWPTLTKFKSLMSTTNKCELLQIAKYIYDASRLREELVSM